MPKNNVCDPTDQEIAFARLVLSGTMTDRRAAETVGLHPDSAAYTKSKPVSALTRKQDPTKAAAIDAWIDQLAAAYEVIPMDASMFRECGRLMAGKSGHLLEDAMIAATARVRGLVVVTGNVRDFEMFRVEALSPFKSA